MGKDSGIEWTHHTFNPWWGCEKISPGCGHCYAATLAHRYGTEWGREAPRRFFGDKHWNEPLKWNKAAVAAGERHRVFCASMADVFEAREDLVEHRARLFRLIEKTRDGLDWLLLTKRPENVLRLAAQVGWFNRQVWSWQTNVWVGTSVEDQQRAEERIPHLLRVPAVVRFLSCEPLLGPLDLDPPTCPSCEGHETVGSTDPEDGTLFCAEHGDEMNHGAWLDPLNDGISWVIAGGESGPKARPMHPDWARSIRDDCARAGVPFHFKQWGEFAHGSQRGVPSTVVLNNGRSCEQTSGACEALARELPGQWGTYHPEAMARVGKKPAGRLLDGRAHDEFPEAVDASR